MDLSSIDLPGWCRIPMTVPQELPDRHNPK